MDNVTLYGLFNYSCQVVLMKRNFISISTNLITKRRLNVAVKYNPTKSRIPHEANIDVSGPGVVSGRSERSGLRSDF